MSDKSRQKQNIGNAEEEIMAKFSYKQELKRSIKLFGSFAVAFSAISITTGISLNYSGVVSGAGTAGIWTWPIVALGQLLVALVFAEISGVIPISGYSYQWVRRLANPGLGWFTGWVSFCFLFIVVPSIDLGAAPYVLSILGINDSSVNQLIVVLIFITLQMILNVVSIKVASLINTAAVYTETFGILLLTVALTICAFKNHAPIVNLLDKGPAAAAGAGYLLPFAMACLMGFYTIVGFEVAANLSEETTDAQKTVPKAIILSVAISGVFGTLFLAASTWSIQNLHQVYDLAASGQSPIPLIITSNLGSGFGAFLMVLMSISIFACGLVCYTSATRMVYALARDNSFFASRLFKKVNVNTNTPIPACILLWILGMLAIIFANSITILAVASAVLPGLYYLITVVSYLRRRDKVKFKEGCFNMGKFGKPVIILAILWLIFEIGILTIPSQFHQAAVVNIAICIIGAVLYFAYFKKRVKENKIDSKKEDIFIDDNKKAGLNL